MWPATAMICLVSILVFVEVALGRPRQTPQPNASPRFQSLFSWKSPSDGPGHGWDRLACLFQSLFSWKSPSDNIISRGLNGPYECFNPCFRGSRPRTIPVPAATKAKIMFQSLFSWKSPSDFTKEDLKLSDTGFQSLFSWKSPSDMMPRILVTRSPEVSILVFVEVALGQRTYLIALRSARAFQSLFSWKSPSDRGFFSSFSPFLTVKPPFSHPPLSTTRTY